MPLADPTTVEDKTEDWLRVFRALRVEALRPLVTSELLAAHRGNPRGPHSRDLNLVLNFVLGPAFPMQRKPFVHLRKPYSEYGLGLMAPRSTAPELLEGATYASESEAIHAAFLERLAAHGLLDEGLVRDGHV